MLILKPVLAQQRPADQHAQSTRQLASKSSGSPLVHVGVKSWIEPIGYLTCREAPDGRGRVSPGDDGRVDRPCGHLGGPNASLLRHQALDCGEVLCLVKTIMEGDVRSVKAVLRDSICGLALPHAEVEAAAGQPVRVSI